jgi:hypothetical protein
MADTHNDWRADRRDDRSADGWLDDRGVSEVIGSILVFGLLVSLLAVVQTQAVPNSNNQVEVKHSSDVQGDISNLQSAIVRTGTFGGTQSTTVETGMQYPPRLVLYNPPSVQGVLATNGSEQVQLANIRATDDETADYLDSTTAPFGQWNTSTLSYRVNYNQYDEAPVVRYEHTAVVNDYGNESTVEARGSLISGNRISLVLLEDGLQETSVRPKSVTTYPVSAPAQSVDVETVNSQGIIVLPTDVNESVWATELLAGQYDTNTFSAGGSPAETGTCNGAGSNAADPDDGRYVVGCSYGTTGSGQARIAILLEQGATYDLAVSKVGFRPSSEPTQATYLTDTTSRTEDVTFEVRDKYNNPIQKRVAVNATTDTLGSGPVTNETYLTGPNGGVTVNRTTAEQAVYLTSGPNSFDPTSRNRPQCANATGCVLIDGLRTASGSTSASATVELKNVTTGGSSSPRLNIALNNTGSNGVNITGIRLGGIQQQEPSGLTLSGTTGISLSGATTEFVDGPDQITAVALSGSSGSLSSPATENEEKETLSSPLALPAKSAQVLSVDFNQNLEVGGSGESVTVTVTVYYSDGSQSTFTQYIHSSDGE